MSRVGYPGTLRTAEQPLVSSGDSQLRALARVIGVNQQSQPFHTDDVRSVETYTLQHLAEGKPQYLGATITSAMQSANAAIFQVMPMLQAQSIKFMHQYYEFVRELAVETPAQAPPNYLEVQESESEATLTRHAIGITTTVQELRTSKGQFFFMGKLIQATVAFIEQAELHAIRALLEQPSFYARYYAARGAYELDLARAGRIKDEYWDILRRSTNGFFELADLVKQDFSMRNLTPSHVIIPEGIRSIISYARNRTEYYRRGPGAAENAEQLGDSIGEELGGLRLVVVRAYDYEQKDLRIEPLDRNAVIGAHFRMAHFWPNCDLSRFCSAYQEIEIYSMDSDEFERLDLETAITSSGRFDEEGRLHPWHYDLVGSWEEWTGANNRTVPIYDNQYDMMIYTMIGPDGMRTANVVSLWGHMEKWALNDADLHRTAGTLAWKIRRVVSGKALEAIAAGLDDINELYELPWREIDVAFAGSSTEIGRFGAPKLPANAQAVGTNYRPRGYGTVAGYMELANAAGSGELGYIDQDLARRANAFRNAAAQVHRAFTEVFDTSSHPALSPKLVSQIFRSPSSTKNAERINSMLNFFQNVVDQNKAAVFVTGSDASPGPQSRLAAFADLPDGSPYETVRDAVETNGSTDRIASAFSSAAAIEETETKFGQSAFGKRYAKYLRNKTAAQGVSEDADQAVLVDADTPLLAQFVANELRNRETEQEKIAILDRALRYVEQGTSPRTITANTIDGWASKGPDQPSVATSSQVSASRTPFASSVDALLNSESGAKPFLRIESPLVPGREYTVSQIGNKATTDEIDGSGANDNLLRTTLFSGAQMPTQGVRGYGLPQSDVDAISTFDGGIQPTYAADAFVDVVGAERVANEHIVERYRSAGQMNDWLERVAIKMVLLAPVTEHTLLSFVRNDIALPIGFLVEQFNRRYTTSSFIFLAQNPSAPVGNVYHLDFDVHTGRDAIRKDIMYHFSGYLGAVINDVRRYFVAHDVVVNGYQGGENAVPFDQETFRPKGLSRLTREGPSLLFFMVPAHTLTGKASPDKVPLEHDIRGYSDQIGNARSAAQYQERPHHKSALYYTTKLRLESITRPTSEDWYRFDRAPSTSNTVTAQGFQRVINPDTRNFTLHINSHDSFKNSVYPGARKLRTSKLPQHYMENVYMPNAAISV